MKIEAWRTVAVLKDPGSFLAILLYGDDIGLIRSRGDSLTRAQAGSLDDPFRVASLEREQHGRLTEEATALAMTGGRRVVRVRDAGDPLTDRVRSVLEAKPSSLLILEAPGLPSNARLRLLGDRHEAIAAIGCYPEDGRTLEATIRAVLREGQVDIDQDALAWVISQLGADHALTQREVEKLSLYCGPGGVADLSAAQACVGDAAAVSLDDALFAATAGNLGGTDRALRQAVAEGAAPVAVVRAALSHLQRLRRARLAVSGGSDAAGVIRAMRPPLFRRREAAFARALSLWLPTDLLAASNALSAAEQSCKRTGAPADVICTHAVLSIARRAGQLERLRRV